MHMLFTRLFAGQRCEEGKKPSAGGKNRTLNRSLKAPHASTYSDTADIVVKGEPCPYDEHAFACLGNNPFVISNIYHA